MLTIFLSGHDYADETPWFYDGTILELFRSVRVVGGRDAFVEISPGHLINVAHIERIQEEQLDDYDQGPAEQAGLSTEEAAVALRRGGTVPLEPRSRP